MCEPPASSCCMQSRAVQGGSPIIFVLKQTSKELPQKKPSDELKNFFRENPAVVQGAFISSLMPTLDASALCASYLKDTTARYLFEGVLYWFSKGASIRTLPSPTIMKAIDEKIFLKNRSHLDI
ncbi:hypothetical protein CBL_12907 [Carabus blaptoides fortunei]